MSIYDNMEAYNDRPGDLDDHLRRQGFRPAAECSPGLHESCMPNVWDCWRLAHGKPLDLFFSTAWLPREEGEWMGGGAAASWGHGWRYRPLATANVARGFDHDRLVDALYGVENGARKYFGPHLGRAMRWLLRGDARQLFACHYLSFCDLRNGWTHGSEEFPRRKA